MVTQADRESPTARATLPNISRNPTKSMERALISNPESWILEEEDITSFQPHQAD